MVVMKNALLLLLGLFLLKAGYAERSNKYR